jgi:hypothetical protein
VQGPFAGKQFWPFETNQLSYTFQNLEMNILVGSLTRWDKFSVHYPFVVKEASQPSLIFDQRFLEAG